MGETFQLDQHGCSVRTVNEGDTGVSVQAEQTRCPGCSVLEDGKSLCFCLHWWWQSDDLIPAISSGTVANAGYYARMVH